jgi:glycosyltransferase involved in cell wall biosynthesis
MKVALLCKMSDKLLDHFVASIQRVESVDEIGLFRTVPFLGDKIRYFPIPSIFAKSMIFVQFYRIYLLLRYARRYDVLIGCFQEPHGILAWLVGKLYGIPVIQSVISEVDWNNGKRLATMAVMNSDACTVMGPICKEKLTKRGYKKLIEIIPLAIDFPKLPEKDFSQKYDLFAVGGFVQEKDYPWMLEVLAELKKEMPDFYMAIRAAGDKRNELPGMIESKGLSENIDLLGFLTEKELAETYLSSKAYLLTSSTEGLTTAMIEAMSYGLPVIVTDVGNLSYLARDKVNGRVVSHGNTDKMAKAILEVIGNDVKRREMSKNSLKIINDKKTEFGVEFLAEKWENLLNSLIS